MTLAFEVITAPAPTPKKTVVLLHGLLGNARSWRGFIRHLNPEWKYVLVDLRNHGQSAGFHFDPPHDIPSTAKDVANLFTTHPHLQPDILIGHSMGGKVALELVKSCGSELAPSQVWVLDSMLGTATTKRQRAEIEQLMDVLPSIPHPFPSRSWIQEQLVKAGISERLANGMSSKNTRHISPGNEYTWLFNLNGVCQMFDECGVTDSWPVLENPPAGVKLGVIRGDRSDLWTPDDIVRMEELSKRHADCISYRVLDNAGHILQSDNPVGLAKILRDEH